MAGLMPVIGLWRYVILANSKCCFTTFEHGRKLTHPAHGPLGFVFLINFLIALSDFRYNCFIRIIKLKMWFLPYMGMGETASSSLKDRLDSHLPI